MIISNLRRYSNVNHATLVVSISDKMGFSTRLPCRSVYCSASRVLTIIPTMETATKEMEVMETICAGVLLSECSIRSQRNF